MSVTARGGTVLVVGASGILAPAAATLVAEGRAVIGVSRRGQGMPPGVEPVALDARTPDSQDAISSAIATSRPENGGLAGRRWDEAIVYAPATTEATLDALRRRTPGRLVLVRVSAAADPALGELDVPVDTVQLGWTADGGWHTPEQVSAAAVAVLADGHPRTLGLVRPWTDRPR